MKRHPGTLFVLPVLTAGLGLLLAGRVASPAWSTVSPGPVIVEGAYEAINPVSGQQQYYRLLLSQ